MSKPERLLICRGRVRLSSRALQLAALAVAGGFSALSGRTAEPVRPNILWISVEDMSPDLGCYGDRYAVTPNLDRLAAQGVRYTHAFAHSPVCAPSRSTLITGRYSTSIGTHQMRCQAVPPPDVRCFPEYLRAAGYYCTNNVKTDYQFPPPPSAWDESSVRAHWRGRAPGQPFFAVFNITITHESQVRSSEPALLRQLATLSPSERHDPAKAVLPPYYPDTPVVRRDWARYHDLITLMDREVGRILGELEADGLAESTIVWFWSDHGRGLPRAKRWPYDSGLHVPLILRVPASLRESVWPGEATRFRPGSTCDEMIGFVDFPPTVLQIAGVRPETGFQGRSFLGPSRMRGRTHIFGHRDRMDEAYDIVRTVRSRRYRYMRNLMPFLPYAQRVDYMEQMPTMQEWRRLHGEARLNGAQRSFMAPQKPPEELYDLLEDPHEIRNLAGDPAHGSVLQDLRRALSDWSRETADLGLLPEPELDARIRPRGWETTASPHAWRERSDESRVRLECETQGASLLYRFSPSDRWRLYHAPFSSPQTASLEAMACRIGFHDSPVVALEPAPAARRPVWGRVSRSDGGEWHRRLLRSNVLDRLHALNWPPDPLPVRVEKALRAIDDRAADVRYWAVLWLHHAGGELGPSEQVRRTVRQRLRDEAAVVRLAAAETLCAWGEADAALPELRALLGDPVDSLRAMSAQALLRLGERSRPLLDALRAARDDRSEYVKRSAEAAVRLLEAPAAPKQ